MDAQGIVDYAVKHTGLTISVTDALTYVNKRRNQVADTIKEKINQGYFWEEFTTDIIAGQREYPLPVADYDKEGISSIERVEVKQKSTDVYRTLQRNSTVPSSYDEMSVGATYFYIVKDSSIILFPTPTESIIGGLVLYANTTLKDIEESTVESEIFGGHTELRQYVQIVAEGVCADLYGRSRQYDDKAQAEAEYDKGIAKMIKAMGNRTKMVDLEVMPDLSMYE